MTHPDPAVSHARLSTRPRWASPTPALALGVALSLTLGACGSERLAAPVDKTEADDLLSFVDEEAVADAASGSQLSVAESRANTPSMKRMPLSVRSTAPMMEQVAIAPLPALDASCCIDPGRPVSEERERYQALADREVIRVADMATSTFSIDVDTGAYANVRRFINQGQLPPEDAVRIEELVNYFDYDYRGDATPERPFAVTTAIGPSPWNAGTRLLQIGVRGFAVERDERPPANLVFLVDVSGSMDSPDKLGLLQASLRLLSAQLDAEDHVAIVVYAGASGVVLEPTPGDQRGRIVAALDRLRAGGSTNGEAGIRTAYALAREHFQADGVNRVILATDGDFNVGLADIDALKALIEHERESGIALTTLGFGTGNYNDYLMEQIADVGNGNHAYIDTLGEARKVLVDQLSATLMTIASDVKIQVEFNPAVVSEYRLIGYVNRHLDNVDFANDRVDAGEIGAGHTVTALYEIALVGSEGQWHTPSRYQPAPTPASRDGALATEIAELRLRYKLPGERESRLISEIVSRDSVIDSLEAMPVDYRFAAAVAGFGQLLRGGRYLGEFDYAALEMLAGDAIGEDRHGYRGEFVRLVKLADALYTASMHTASVDGTDVRDEPGR